ncbi:MAG TPA: PhzF family phenazine biosynthesis protein [Desulfosarcina sp.]|nr:PhzF family phenazine biosynthesis protein [Desulfosarcina sp.]
MKAYRVIYMDAFTSEPFSGNPCAVLPQAEGLTDAQMQKIALETNLSETAFVFPSDKAAVRVRYFMPRKEIPFAGHPTIATAMMLAQENLLPHDVPVLTAAFEFTIGVLPVEIHYASDGMPLKAVMTQRKPVFGDTLEIGILAEGLGLGAEDFRDNVPLQVVDTGVPFLVAPVKGLNILRKARINPGPFQTLLDRVGVDAAYLFCLGGFGPDVDAHGRLFSSTAGAEDPFTGSAAGCMGAYMARYGLRPGPVFTVEQGHLMGRPGVGTIEVQGSGNAVESVKVGGNAVKTLEGVIYVNG